MPQRCRATTADVLICFQQNPGTADVEIIKGGEAWVKGGHGPTQQVGKGYYGLRMQSGETRELEIFGTTYEVKHKAKNADEAAAATRIINWNQIWDRDNNRKIQHYLQLLGYYQGTVNGSLGLATEKALLNFQADNGLISGGLRWLRADDRDDSAALAQAALDKIQEVADEKNLVQTRSSTVYLIRKSLLSFTRSPTPNPTDTRGPADPRAPEVDDRGFGRAKANGHRCRGPVTSYSFDPSVGANNDFRVKVIREGISNAATLIAESESPEYVHIPNANLAGDRYMNLDMRVGDPGGRSKKVRVYIKWQKKNGELVTIATLRVIVMRIIPLSLRPYRVAIRQSGPGGGAYEEPHLTNVQLNAAFERANAIWRPFGIKFVCLAWPANTHQIALAHAGRVAMTNALNEWIKVLPANYEHDKINVYVVKEINGPAVGPYGAARSPIRVRRAPPAQRKPGVVIECRQEGALRTGDTLAHELGHYLGLANNFGNNQLSHSEDDPDAPDVISNVHKKRDVWSIRRLMLGTAPGNLTSHVWAHHVGYSNPAADPAVINGKMVSVRNLPGDKTDDECRNARKRARSRRVYHP